ncbi:MAG: NCS2 family permease [Campylobacterales bacterium]|nr:NCS2 family permease [Campylobacterales bacterium]
MELLERIFGIRSRHSTLSNELIGGVSTYMTLAYILIVQPIVLSAAGMEFGAVLTATALASALACFIMGFYANYPIALAPAMGHNFYFAFAVVLGMGIAWQEALAAVFTAGVLFVGLTLLGIRRTIMDALPLSLLNAIGVGIGLLIALVGLEWSGIIVDAQGTLVGLGDLSNGATLLSLFGLGGLSILAVRGTRGAILIAIALSALAGFASGLLEYRGLFSAPPSLSPTAFALDFSLFWSAEFWVIVAVFIFLDLFDTIGTFAAVAPEAGLTRSDGTPDISNKAMLADSSATVIGALLGTSTITSYVESASGIAEGARTGLAAVVTGVLLLLSPLLYPLIQSVAGGVQVSPALTLYPVAAPVLIFIGVVMMKRVRGIDWERMSEAIPAFLTITVMMLSLSITEGIAFGIISYSLLSLFERSTKVHILLHVLALILLGRYLFLV